MIDLFLVVSSTLLAVLLSSTAFAAYQYYKQLRQTQKEYEKAKDFVGDIVLSFNRELKREAERILNVTYKVEVNEAKADAGLQKAEEVERKLEPLESQITQISTQLDSITTTMSAISQANVKTLEKMASTDFGVVKSVIEDIKTNQDLLKGKIVSLEEEIQKCYIAPEIKGEAAVPVIPIRRDKALAALTQTEIQVLEYLSSEGPKTAPEIKEQVKLSREHTARLMKKLYEEGYVERETGKLPFKYRVKEEMQKLLKKPEPTI
jgi:hypothetical protein